jgi:hypothetical protein
LTSINLTTVIQYRGGGIDVSALALLKVLALTGRSVAEGKAEPVADVFARIRDRLKN